MKNCKKISIICIVVFLFGFGAGYLLKTSMVSEKSKQIATIMKSDEIKGPTELFKNSLKATLSKENGKILKNGVNVTDKFKENFKKLYEDKNFDEIYKIFSENNLSLSFN